MEARRPIPLVSLDNGWDYQNQHVQPNMDAGAFISGKSVLLLAGPAKLEELTGAADLSKQIVGDGLRKLYMLGVAQQFSFNQALPSQEIHEIGSERSYFIRARTAFSATIGKVLYNGPNLLRSLYAYSPFQYAGVSQQYAHVPILSEFTQQNGYSAVDSLKGIRINELPGYGDLWINGKSDLFNYPFGLGVLFADTTGELLGAMYIEDAFIQGHSMSIGATSTIIMESASLRFDKIRPIRIKVKVNESREEETRDAPSVVAKGGGSRQEGPGGQVLGDSSNSGSSMASNTA